MKKLLIIFSLVLILFATSFAAENNATNGTVANLTVNTSDVLNVTVNQTAALLNITAMHKNMSNVSMSQKKIKEMSPEDLAKIQAMELEPLQKQVAILTEEVQELRKENAQLKQRIAELEKKPVTWEDVQETVDTYYMMFTFWTGWLWPLLTFFLIFKYRKPAREEKVERIEEAAEKVATEKQREWFNFQIHKRGIESVAEDETELAIFKALGLNTIGDLLDADEPKLIEAFRSKYHPTADLEEHFKNRIKDIKDNKAKEVD